MDLAYTDISGNVNIGVSILTTNNHTFIPEIDASERFVKLIENTLHTEVIEITETIFGSLAVANSNGLVVSNVVKGEVIDQIKATGLEIYQAKEYFAFGNIFCANDYAGLISPIVPVQIRNNIQKTLGIPLYPIRIANSDLVGSLICVTNYGALITPLAEDNEVSKIKELLKIEEADIGTTNKGSEFVSSGIVANKHGVLVGPETTGIEIMQISKCFGL